MDEAAIKRTIQKNNEQLMSQITDLITNTVQGLKRTSEDQAQEQIREIKKLKYSETPVFKKKSNEDQYKSTNVVKKCLEEASDHLENKRLDQAKESINKGKHLLEERQKLIRLADKSPFGWKTVLEYKQHDLAADDEDEKKIYRAEARAARESKRYASTRSKRFDNTQRSIDLTTPFPDSNWQVRNDSPFNNFRSIPTYRSRFKSPGVCFACGKPGHWRASCPLLSTSAQKQDK